MTDRPINYTADLVRQLRGGGISQLRRPHGVLAATRPGDRLWIREPFYLAERFDQMAPLQAVRLGMTADDIHFAAAGDPPPGFGRGRFARVLPHALHRMHLRVVAVRDGRLQDLTDADARAEGASSRATFPEHWDGLHARDKRSITGDAIAWADNPRVTIITFDRVDTPIGKPGR